MWRDELLTISSCPCNRWANEPLELIGLRPWPRGRILARALIGRSRSTAIGSSRRPLPAAAAPPPRAIESNSGQAANCFVGRKFVPDPNSHAALDPRPIADHQ